MVDGRSKRTQRLDRPTKSSIHYVKARRRHKACRETRKKLGTAELRSAEGAISRAITSQRAAAAANAN